MDRAVLAIAVLLGLSSGAVAAEIKPPADQSSATTPVDPKQVVCRHIEDSGQSMLPGAKVCHTRAEWAGIDRQGGHTATQPSDNGH